jgi:Uracil phosphoribosyltransferase
MGIRTERFLELEEIFNSKKWEIDKSAKKFSSLFNRFSSRLDVYRDEEQKLILDLTKDFTQVFIKDLDTYFFNSIRLIKDIDQYSTIIFAPLKYSWERKIKSADHLWYHAKSFFDFSYESFDKKKYFTSNWKTVGEKVKQKNSLLILLDDFIGTGGTGSKIIKQLKGEGILNSNYYVLTLLGQDEGIKNLVAEFGNIIACACILNKGISDKFEGEELVNKTKLMLQMEKVINVEPEFEFGFGRSESLIAIHGKSPNNTFPVFWLEKGGKLAPFKTR